jgi:hypothetical protein
MGHDKKNKRKRATATAASLVSPSAGEDKGVDGDDAKMVDITDDIHSTKKVHLRTTTTTASTTTTTSEKDKKNGKKTKPPSTAHKAPGPSVALIKKTEKDNAAREHDMARLYFCGNIATVFCEMLATKFTGLKKIKCATSVFYGVFESAKSAEAAIQLGAAIIFGHEVICKKDIKNDEPNRAFFAGHFHRILRGGLREHFHIDTIECGTRSSKGCVFFCPPTSVDELLQGGVHKFWGADCTIKKWEPPAGYVQKPKGDGSEVKKSSKKKGTEAKKIKKAKKENVCVCVAK